MSAKLISLNLKKLTWGINAPGKSLHYNFYDYFHTQMNDPGAINIRPNLP